MSRTRTSSRTSRRLTAAIGAVGALAALGQASALAIPPGGPLPPPPQSPPKAKVTASPNPAVVRAAVLAPTLPANTLIKLGTQITFDASGSVDLDGSIVKYQWDLDANGSYEKSTNVPTVKNRYTQRGLVNAKVKVTDNSGKTDTATVGLRLHGAPVAKITPSKTVALVGETVTFDSAGSSDDNGIAKREWDLDGDGTYDLVATTANTSFATSGPHKVGLRITDIYGAKRVTQTTVRAHTAPTALLASQPIAPSVGQTVTLDGSSSTDDGTIAKYEFDLNGDGTYETDTATTPTTTTSFPTAGPRIVGLRVTDADGATGTTSLALQVSEVPVTAAADTRAPRLRPRGKRLKMNRTGVVRMRVSCPRSEQLCVVSARTVGITKPLRGRTLGRSRIGLQGGQTKTMTMKLNRRAKRIVRKKKVVRARVVLTTRDGARNTARTRTVVRIRR